jgi:hypothetical protein
MTCDVKIIEDSINPYNGARLTTFQLRYWRAFHSEFMTHRLFSRNASSSRAIPINKIIKQVWNDPAGPVHWGKNKSGMQADEELTGFKRYFTKFMWKFSSKVMCSMVWLTNKVASPHKQTLNRLLEPWQYISVIVSGTEWDNYFSLRDHPAAQPEIQELARKMKSAMKYSKPVSRAYHLPYVTEEERSLYRPDICMKLSTARCARVSYLTHDGKKPDFEKDIRLHDRLVGSVPIHASPTEHSAMAVDTVGFMKNFKGWEQYRVKVEANISKLGERS